MKQNAGPNLQLQREGIALIVVLGFLSILVLMAVAFLIAMRTERFVAETAKDDVRVRHLTQSALAFAMDDVNGLLRDYDLSTTQKLTAVSKPVNIRVPPSWAVIPSTNPAPPSTDLNLGAKVRLISGEVTNWLSRKYLSSQNPDYNATGKAARANWVLIRDPHPLLLGQPANILGRYAYVAFDCTGMLDANLLTYPAERGVGKSGSEISATNLPEVNKFRGDQALLENRTAYSRFGTFSEILFLNDGITNNSRYDERDALTPSEVDNLIPYSLCYDHGWWNWTNATWTTDDPNIDVRGWSKNTAQQIFQSLGYSQPDVMAACFKDYTDTDDILSTDPKTQVCGEAIPMINEIVLRSEILAPDGGGSITHNVWFDVELWYPFLGYTNPHNYRVFIESAKFSSKSETKVGILKPDDINGITYETMGAPTYNFQTGGQFRVAHFLVSKSEVVPLNDLRSFSINARGIKIQIWDEDDADGNYNIVDIAQPPASLAIAVAFQGDIGALPKTQVGSSLSVNDPRLNHISENWTRPSSHTLERANTNLLSFNRNISNQLEGVAMYVRNSTNLESVAELGFIPTGERWTTIDLFTPQGRELLTKYRIGSFSEKIYTNGLINPNSAYTNVLEAAFLGAPVDEFPGGPTNSYVNEKMARDIVRGMYEVTTNKNARGPTNTFDSAAAWVTTKAFALDGTLMTGDYDMDNGKKESIIRNTYRLFNPNQQLFTIVVIAQTIKDQGEPGKWEEDQDTISGEKRAVALVWRDPFPDSATGRHEMFVRLFKYLNE